MDLLTSIFGIEAQYENWNKQGVLPLYIAGSYKFQTARLNGCECIILTPEGVLDTLPALKKQIKKIQEIDNVPVVLRLSAVSAYRRKNLIEGRIPFITNKQVFLPFMGAYLTKENEETAEIKKFMFSTQQLILLYLYSGEQKLYVSEAVNKLPFTAMTMSRAVKQLEMTGLFHIWKDGVSKVIEARYDRHELFEKIRGYLSTPVRRVGYLEKANRTKDMVIAGETVLAEETMLNPGRLETYAVYVKSVDKSIVVNELIDPDKQIRIELWEYDPKQFSDDYMADKLSVALSFSESTDERIEKMVEELLESVWRK
ncbi:MAG: hypothetical protein NC086_05520 [Alistipes sp.]|nr:hypothetical protein [Alistipes sp.]